MEDRLYEKSDDISTERDAQISMLLKTGEYDELQTLLKKREVLRFANIELFKLINAFNSYYRKPENQLIGLKALKRYGLTKVEISGESLDLNFLGAESKIHPVKVLFDPTDNLIKKLNDYDYRKGKCHSHCLELANIIQGDCSVLTGFMYGYTNKTKYLHSVLRIEVGGKQGIIDTTLNSLMTEEFYKKLTDFEVLTEIPSSIIKEDYDLLMKSGQVNMKEYYLHRDEYVKTLQTRQRLTPNYSIPIDKINNDLNDKLDHICEIKK